MEVCTSALTDKSRRQSLVRWISAGAAAVGTAYFLHQQWRAYVLEQEYHAELQSQQEVVESEECNTDYEFCLRVACDRGGMEEVRVRIQTDKVDLTAFPRLMELPMELRRLSGSVRELTVASSALHILPDWLGELTHIEMLRVGGEVDEEGCLRSPCPMAALPAGLGSLVTLRILDLRDCEGLIMLPDNLRCLTALEMLDLGGCELIQEVPVCLRDLTALRTLRLQNCTGLTVLPSWLGELTALQALHMACCTGLHELPTGIGNLTALRTLILSYCRGLSELPASIGDLTMLEKLDLCGCHALHTPPPTVVGVGLKAIMQFLRDLGKGFAPCHLVKVVLLGEQRAGKSSLVDSLVDGFPATRAHDNRTVGIDVRRWWLGGEELLVVYFFDSAGQRVYRASHPLFMSAEALFLHVVRSDVSEKEAVAALLEWVEAVQQEAPGAIMGVVWTHVDLKGDNECRHFHQTVLAQVKTEIERHVLAVDVVMRQAEVEFEFNQLWRDTKALRDTYLKSLDRGAMVEWLDEELHEAQERNGKTVDDKRIKSMADALMQLTMIHNEMQNLEYQIVSRNPEETICEQSIERLQRLRQQRVLRPRILFSHAVSSLTGHGLQEFRHALSTLMQTQRIFPHVGRKVPLNYAMLERLSQEGRRKDSQSLEHCRAAADTNEDTIEFMWAQFCKRSQVRDYDVVLCDPDCADANLINTTQLRGKMAVAKRGGCAFTKKAQRVAMAGAIGLIIINNNDTLFAAPGAKWYFSKIPVVMIKAKDADILLLSGNSSGLYVHEGRATWENAVTKHVFEKASKGLRQLCARPYVTLEELVKETLKIGMDRAELHRALKFLHVTGSVLLYGTGTLHHTKETVFMQPQFIIDAIKYVIREPMAEDVNEELRNMDELIRCSDLREDLDLFLGSGELTRSLLTELWTLAKFSPDDHELLLELIKAFKLVRVLGVSGNSLRERYLVPAMLPCQILPTEYIAPAWWCPAKADHSADCVRTGTPVEMRVKYEVLGGRLPFSFMCELQVSLSLGNKNSQHFAAETTIVDRVAGSVLSETYKCGGGCITEWVVVSQSSLSCQVVAAEGKARVSTSACGESDSIRVMAWVELMHTSDHGASDWRLFKRVMQVIEYAERSRIERGLSGLFLQKQVLHVDVQGRCAKSTDIPVSLSTLDFLEVIFEDGMSKSVDASTMLPLENAMTHLIRRKEARVRPEPASPEGTAKFIPRPNPRVDAFFSKTKEDLGIDVHQEGQRMTRIILDPACGWEFTPHQQPTLEDLVMSTHLASQRNVKVIHLSGHGKKECGFIWNEDDAATAGKESEIHNLAGIIGSAAGQMGPIECAVLNACSTENLGRLLRQSGMPYVVCWRTPVQDETAREMCEHFYRALMRQSVRGCRDEPPKRDYRMAFDAAMETMRKYAFMYTIGAARPPAGSKPAATRGKVVPWKSEDVIQFLSKDGDSEPIYLWPTPASP